MIKGTSLAAAALATALLSPIAAHAAPGPFAAMEGSWSGSGVLTMADGSAEQLRCRASYNTGAGSDLRLTIKCASQGYNFELGSNVVYQGGRISGTWSEASRNASGTIAGRASADQIQAAATGDNFTANLSLTTRGNRQTVSIRSQGTDIAAVALALNRN